MGSNQLLNLDIYGLSYSAYSIISRKVMINREAWDANRSLQGCYSLWAATTQCYKTVKIVHKFKIPKIQFLKLLAFFNSIKILLDFSFWTKIEILHHCARGRSEIICVDILYDSWFIQRLSGSLWKYKVIEKIPINTLPYVLNLFYQNHKKFHSFLSNSVFGGFGCKPLYLTHWVR